jgi:hypothetical protein
MKRIRLRSIPEPEPNTRTVFVYEGPGTAVFRGVGAGGTTFVCASCESPLAEDVGELQLRNLVLVCKGCGAFNELP